MLRKIQLQSRLCFVWTADMRTSVVRGFPSEPWLAQVFLFFFFYISRSSRVAMNPHCKQSVLRKAPLLSLRHLFQLVARRSHHTMSRASRLGRKSHNAIIIDNSVIWDCGSVSRPLLCIHFQLLCTLSGHMTSHCTLFTP